MSNTETDVERTMVRGQVVATIPDPSSDPLNVAQQARLTALERVAVMVPDGDPQTMIRLATWVLYSAYTSDTDHG